MNACRIGIFASIFICFTSVKAALSDAMDDFSGDSGQWRFGSGGGKGKHTLQNGRLEFSTGRDSTSNDSATHYWATPIGSYNESWEVQADVFLGRFALGKDPYAGLALQVGMTSNPAGSFVRAQLRCGDKDSRALNADAFANRAAQGSKWVPTTSERTTIRLRFDANTKVISVACDVDASGTTETFITIYSINIGKGAESWEMKNKDTFEFSIVSQSVRSVVSPGDMFFDNVRVRNLGP